MWRRGYWLAFANVGLWANVIVGIGASVIACGIAGVGQVGGSVGACGINSAGGCRQ